MKHTIFNIAVKPFLAILLTITIFVSFAFPSETFASDLPEDYNSKMVKAYGGYGTLYTVMMAAYGPNTYNKYYKPATSKSDGWEFTYYWKDPSSGASARKWNNMSAMESADVLPKAGDIIVFCNGEDIGRNAYGDYVSLTHVGVVISDTDKNGVYYTMEGNYRGYKSVVINKRTISGTYLDYSRMNINPYSITAHYKLYAIVHNTSDEVRNLVVQTAYYERTKYLADKVAYRKQIARDIQYDGEWCVGFGARCVLEHPTIGYLSFRASSPFLRSAASFKGAQYRVYIDSDCYIPAGPLSQVTFTLDENGYSDKLIVLAPGTYYVKQLTIPTSGDYIKNTAISPVTVSANMKKTATGGNMVQIPNDVKAFFVGNSYTSSNNLPEIVADMFKRDGISFDADFYTSNKSGLGDHVKNSIVKEAISSGKYDYVILQESSVTVLCDSSITSGYINTMMKWAPSSTRFYLYETMSYRGHPEEQVAYTKAYYNLADLTGTSVIPAGEAFWSYANAHPSETMFVDSQHPTYIGSYVIAKSVHDTIMADPAMMALVNAFSFLNNKMTLYNGLSPSITGLTASDITYSSASDLFEISEITGDVNGDGEADPRDYVMIINHINEKKLIKDEKSLSAADVNKDGAVDSEDADIVKKLILNKQ